MHPAILQQSTATNEVRSLLGSLAAGIHAGIGNVVAGSAFATVQSAAMAGYGTAVVGGIVQGVGVAVAAGGAAYGVLKMVL
jgi:hypothetical protein